MRQFRFADKEGEEAKWVTVQLTFRVVDRATAESIAEASAVLLPPTDSGTWSVTVPPTPKQIVEEACSSNGG